MFTKKLFIFFFILSLVFALVNGSSCDELQRKDGIDICNSNSEGGTKYLYIDTSKLTQDTIDTIGNYTEIESLSFFLTENINVTTFQPFSFLTNLTKVDMRTDGIKPVPKDLLNSLKPIKTLEFIDIELDQENIDELSTMTSLETLSIRHSSFDPAVDYSPLKNLTNLNVLFMEAYEYHHHNYYKRLTEIPDFVFELTNLTAIHIAAQDVTKFPEQLSNLKQLELLDISDNKIDDTLPESLNDLPELKTLIVSGNINLKGKTLTNAKLERCYYSEHYNLCKAKDMDCLKENDFNIKECSGMLSNDDYSTNGQCGNGNGKCPPGFCCSKEGWCGKTDSHCSITSGCQLQFGICNGEPGQQNDGRCGKEFGKCPSGQCCSKDGYCGVNDSHCLVTQGCQSEFGICFRLKYTVDGSCGPEAGRCPPGQCCSKYGWCGKSSAYCDAGCQSEFGDCNKN